MKSFLKYPGGKNKEIPLVNKYMPKKINNYYEPFVGGGSIYFDLNIKNSFINDKSFDLYKLYILIKEQSEELKNFLLEFDNLWKVIEKEGDGSNTFFDNVSFMNTERINKYTKFYESALKRKKITIEKFENNGLVVSNDDKTEVIITARKTAVYMLIREAYNTLDASPLKTATFFFLREYCYSSMFRFSKNGNFNVPYGGRSYNYKYMLPKINYIFSKTMEGYFKNTKIYNLDFEDFLKKMSLKNDDFIFLDPPYDTDFSTYDQNSFDKDEQVRLKDFLSTLKTKWMLIIKKTDFISDLYKKYNIIEYDMNYMVSFKNRNNRDVKHLLITNYKIGE